jgi:hypothetical protein
MMKKIGMITMYLLISWQVRAEIMPNNLQLRMPAAATENTTKSHNICSIHAGDIGKLKYKADTYEKAFEKVTNECFQRRSDLYVKNRNVQPDQDRQIQFAESCVNSVHCI